MDMCKNNINGHCKMFGRREKCEECSEYCCEEEELQGGLPKFEEEEVISCEEAFQRFIEKLTDKYLEDKGQRPKDIA